MAGGDHDQMNDESADVSDDTTQVPAEKTLSDQVPSEKPAGQIDETAPAEQPDDSLITVDGDVDDKQGNQQAGDESARMPYR